MHSNSEKILPIKDNITRAWPEHNFLLSMILNKETAYDWVMNTYIQTYASHFIGYGFNDRRITFYPIGGEKTGIYDLCPYLYKYIVPRGKILNKYSRFSDFVIETINLDFYICNMLDQFFRTSLNGEPGYLHLNYIYGYNSKECSAYIIDNFEDGIYKTKKISFDDLNRSYDLLDSNPRSYGQYHLSPVLYELTDYKHIFDIKLVVELLKDYINPSNMCYLQKYSNLKNENFQNKTSFGINSYTLLDDYLNEVLAGNETNKDWRSFSFLCDHKKLMKLRYDYLVSKCFLEYDGSLMKEFETLEEECTKMQNIFIKYCISEKKEYIVKICDKLNYVKNKDKSIIEYLIEKLDMSHIEH